MIFIHRTNVIFELIFYPTRASSLKIIPYKHAKLTSTSLLTFFLLWLGCFASAVGGGRDFTRRVAVSTIFCI